MQYKVDEMGWSSGGVIKQFSAALIITLGLITQGNQLIWPPPTPIKSKTGNLTHLEDKQKDTMISLLYSGSVLSPIPCDYLTDFIGRKRTCIFLSFLPLLSWSLASTATTPLMLYASRFLSGLWTGVAYTVIPMYLGEIADEKLRGALTSFIQIMTFIGLFGQYFIGHNQTYECLCFLNNITVIVFFCLFLFVPESPYWLMMKKRRTDAEKALRWLRGDKKPDLVLRELNIIEHSIKEEMKRTKSYRDLLMTEGSLKGLIISVALSTFQRLSGITGMIAHAALTLHVHKKYIDIYMTTMGVIWTISVFINTMLVDTMGRKPLLSISCIGTGMATAIAALWLYLRNQTDIYLHKTGWVPYSCFIFYGVFYSTGLGPVAGTIQSEVFPMNIKAHASAITAIAIGGSSYAMNKIYVPIANDKGMYFNFVIFSLSSFLCQLFVIFFVVETKGKTLQEIQEVLHMQYHPHV